MTRKLATFHVNESDDEYQLVKRKPSGCEIEQTVVAEIPKEAEDELFAAIAGEKDIAELTVQAGPEIITEPMKIGDSVVMDFGLVTVTIESLLGGGANE